MLGGFGETLRNQGMPYEELHAVLLAEDPVIVRRYLELHRERLEEGLAEQLQILDRLEMELDPAPARR